MKKAISQTLLTFILNGISILSLIFLTICLFSYRNVNTQLNLANEERFDLTYNANLFMDGSSYLTNEVRAFAATGFQEHYDNYWNEVNTLKNRDKGVAAMQAIGITSEEQQMIDDMSALSNQLVPLEDEAMRHVQEGNTAAALDYVYGTDYNDSIARINALKEQFLSALDTRTSERLDVLMQESSQIRLRMILALIVVEIMLLCNILLVRLKVLRPIMSVKKQMREISQGNLSAEFELRPDTSEIGTLVASIHETKHELKKYISDINTTLTQMAQGNMDLTIGNDYRGEFLPIQRAMRQILDSLNDALSQINRTSQQVSEESGKMSTSAHSLADGATEQAAAVEELSASILEISKQVSNTSSDADTANRVSEEAMRHLTLCNEKMEALSAAIDEISNSSRQIGGITKAIQDISLQTNILALNASVEAARAGEAGKGFAVVAGEVQSLANKSAESAKNISALIENSIKQVQNGAALSVETMNALTQVISSGEQSAAMIERIASSATQQAESLEQVTQGMHQISDVVQTNASTAEGSASSAQELQHDAEALRIAVHRFHLRRR
ncbi:MAG: methyl-accepting chemotaxis protein [Lachnospiraceae bacterium]|nr:methyl-accepting chemotaxis protein [Lachnospiraceae bacterium]MDE7273546.1 methyl-accepting chemotaxis protein [Lachnospiraceae bacterium]